MSYLADDETYTRFFTPPQSAGHKGPQSSAVATTIISGPVMSMKICSVPVTTISMTSATISTTMTSSSVVDGGSIGCSGISGVVSIVSGGGGVMGVGASSSSIAESLSKLALSHPTNAASAALQALTKQAAGEAVPIEGGDGTNIMEKYAKENLNIHTRGLLRKKVPVIDMISWTKDAIRKPLLSTVEKSCKGQAGDMFRLVQVYMGDRKSRVGMTLNSVALDIVTMAYTASSLRDELFVQLCKQTTDNQKKLVNCKIEII